MLRFTKAITLCRIQIRAYSTRYEEIPKKIGSKNESKSITPTPPKSISSSLSSSSSSFSPPPPTPPTSSHQPTNKSRKSTSRFVSSYQRSRAPVVKADEEKLLMNAVEHLQKLVSSGQDAEARAYSMSFCVSRAAAGITNSSAVEWSMFLRHSLGACLHLSDFAGASEIWSLVEKSAKNELSSFTASMKDFEALLSVAAVSGSRQDATQILHKMKRSNLNYSTYSSNNSPPNGVSGEDIKDSIDTVLWPPSSHCVSYAMQSLARNGIPYRSISLFEDHFSNARYGNLDKARLSLALCLIAASVETSSTMSTSSLSSSSLLSLKQEQLVLDLSEDVWKALKSAYSLDDDVLLSSQIPVAAHCAMIEAARRIQNEDMAALWLDRFRMGISLRNKKQDEEYRVLEETASFINSQWGPETLVSSSSSSSSSSTHVTHFNSDNMDDIVRVSNHPLSPFVSAARTFLDVLPQSPRKNADRVIDIFKTAVKDGLEDNSEWWHDLLIVTATAEALSGRAVEGIASIKIRDMLNLKANEIASNAAANDDVMKSTAADIVPKSSFPPWHNMAYPLVRSAGLFRNSSNHNGAEMENLAINILKWIRKINGRVPRVLYEARAASAADAGDIDSALSVIDSLAEDKVAASPYMFESVFEACLKAQSGHGLQGRSRAQYALARFVSSGMHPTPRISALLKRIDEHFVAEEEKEKEARRVLSISKLRRRGLRGSRIINQRFGELKRSEMATVSEDAADKLVEAVKSSTDEANSSISINEEMRLTEDEEKEKKEEEKKDSSDKNVSLEASQIVSIAPLPSVVDNDDDDLRAFRSSLLREEQENKQVDFISHEDIDEVEDEMNDEEDISMPLDDNDLARFSIIRASRDCGLKLHKRDSRILSALKAADEQDSGFDENNEERSTDSSINGGRGEGGGDALRFSDDMDDDEVVLDGHKPLPSYMLGVAPSNDDDENQTSAPTLKNSKEPLKRESSTKQFARAFAQRRINVSGLEDEEA
jgi:hypothetical protein